MARRISYFAYGSNMDVAQMKSRCQSAKCLGRFVLENHVLCFPRRSGTNWAGSGVASIVPKEGQSVEGVLYDLVPSQWEHLCSLEGVPNSYEVKDIRVRNVESRRLRQVKVFVAIPEEPNASYDPDPEYIETLERGAKTNKLSMEYRDYLKGLKTKSISRRQLGDVVTETVQLVDRGTPTSKAVCQDCQKEYLNAMCPEHPKATHTITKSFPMGVLTVKWRIGPLHFYLAEPPKNPATDTPKPPLKESDVLSFLCREGLNAKIDGFVSRYLDLSKDDLVTVPEDDTIREKIVLPLLEAKTSYMLGNYFAVITLCGMVCEVLSVLRYEMSPLSKGASPLSADQQRRMFGAAVDNLTQDRRLQLLHALGYIDDQTYADFDDVRNIRNNYVHLSTNKVTGRASEAKRLYLTTVKLIKLVFGLKSEGDKHVMGYALIDYLLRKRKPAPSKSKSSAPAS